MLTKSQAQAAADALVEGGKAKRIGWLEARAARIPPYYRNRSLSRVPTWRQAQLVGEARRTAAFTWLAPAAMGCMLLLALAVWFSSEHARPLATLGPAVLALGGFGSLFRVMLVKLRFQELLLQELAPQQSNGISQETPSK